MRHEVRFASLLLVVALLLGFGASSAAQQIRYETFSSTSGLRLNGVANKPAGQNVLRLTDAGANPEASTVYFVASPASSSGGKQPVAGGFTTWFQFQIHNLVCCNPGDGVTFIIQNSNATDATMGATGSGVLALGAGGNMEYPDQAGALGYAGINNSLVIELDVFEDLWDPTSNHVAIQTCGPNYNTPVHKSGVYQIGNNGNVQSCLLSIDSNIGLLGGMCNGETCTDGAIHDVVITYIPPPMGQEFGSLQIWVDPTFFDHTHTPTSAPTIIVPYNIVYDSETNTSGLELDPLNGGSAWVGFTASQPSDGEQQDILAWEFTPHTTSQISQIIPPGGVPAVYPFGSHQLSVTYPIGFSNPNGTTMTVNANPVSRSVFYQTRLFGTGFANEQCIVYEDTGNGFIADGNCIDYSVTCNDSSGNGVSCPAPATGEIGLQTKYNTLDPVTSNNADYLETCPQNTNTWFTIFTAFYNDNGTTSGSSKGLGGYPGGDLFRPFAGSDPCSGTMSADLVATFRPGNGGK